ncbi:MAG: type I secretion C-terminal target domain-containing protein [Rhodocyclaceae bacterium]|nr:type I secretion C-terminal target domain-containing protein [Rhodocyclaceae bacterium]
MSTNGTTWTSVAANQLISKATVDAGWFRFVPDTNESGADAFGGTSTGNRQSDYASFNYQGYDGTQNSATATARIDITPVVDAPTVTASNASGTEGQWVSLTLSAALTDLDGSEALSGRLLTGIPIGASITDGTNTFTATAGNTSLSLTGWNLSALQFQGSATGTSQTYTMTLSATSTESSTGSATTSAVSFNVTVTDTAPVAIADTDSVGVGATTTGNVITGAGGVSADTLGFDTAQLTNVSYVGTPLSSSNVGGVWTIATTNGTLTINQSGAFSYVSNYANKSVSNATSAAIWDAVNIDYYGFDREGGVGDANPFTGGTFSAGLNTATLTAGAASLITFANNTGIDDDGMGVERGSLANNANNRLENGEFIVLDMNMATSAMAVTLNNLPTGNSATWYAYSASGGYLGTGTIAGDGDQIVTATITSVPGARYLVFAGGANDYRIGGVIAQPDLSSITPDVFNYTLTDSDGDASSTTLTINSSSLIGAIADIGTVYESGLAAGTEAGQTSITTSGNLLANDTGVPSTVEITTVAGQTPVGGVITVTNAIGTLTVYTVTSGSNQVGDYTYTLNAATTQGSNDAQTFSYTARNTLSGQTSSSSLTINVIDDAPIGSNVVQTLQAAATLPTYNLVLTIDVSGSMDGMVGNTGKTRLQVAKEALAEMIQKFDQIGNVNVQIVAFSETTSESPWYVDNPAAALAYINSLEPLSGTRYSTALDAVMNGFTQPTADKTIFYFLSDGEPNAGYEVGATQQATWQNFVDANGDLSFGIGIGTSVSLTALNPIAYPNGTNEPYAIVVDDPAELADTLLSTVEEGIVLGDVSILSNSGASGFLIGADGGNLQSVVVDGVTYTYVVGSPSVTVVTAKGGELTINFVTGEYSYQLTVNTTIQGQQEVFPITAIDGDGDSRTINLTINLDYIANLDANRDIILTNVTDGSALTISTEALTHNDYTAGTTSFTGTSTPLGGTVSTASGVVTFDPTSALATSTSDFGVTYTTINEAAGDSFSNPLNNSIATAVNLTNRGLFGRVTGVDAADLTDPELPTVKFTGTLNATNGNQDSDYIRVSLRAGETIYLDVDRGVDAGGAATSIDSRLYLYDQAGNQLAINSTSVAVDAGSTSTADPYLAYTVGVAGDYYVRVRHQSNATATDAGGNYDLWISISPQVIPSTAAVGFDYTLTDSGESDTTSASVYGVTGSTITGSATDEILYGSGSADVLLGNAGKDVLLGNAGDDTLRGGSGDDRLEGGQGSDTLDGGTGADILLGGAGNDTLTGGIGADVFVWDLADKGPSGTPAIDTITDFDTVSSSDKLDLRDLLVGEFSSGGNANLANFLHFELSGGNTVLHISSNGGFASDSHNVGGTHSSGSEDQTIVLQGVDLIGSFTTDQQVIQDLLNRGKLQTD